MRKAKGVLAERRCVRAHQQLRLLVGPRGAVWMGRLHCHPISIRAGGGGQGLAPHDVAAVADLAPVHGAQYDRLAGTVEDQTDGVQGLGEADSGGLPAGAQRMADGTGHIHLE